MNFDSHIFSVSSREILDSRGYPTLETTVILGSGFRGIAAVPSGTSVGKYEALELRDKNSPHYHGLGVLTARDNVNSKIHAKLKGMDCLNQGLIDKTLVALDGTPDKHNLGANAILSTSMATAVAASNLSRIPLYHYLNQLFGQLMNTPIQRIPIPIIEMINGGKHGAGNLEFQEFHIIPASNKSFSEGLEMGVEIYHGLGDLLIHRNAIRSVGFEGGYAPNLFTNAEGVDIILEATKEANYHYGVDVFSGLDLAANYFRTDRGYLIKDRPSALNPIEYLRFLEEFQKKYHFLLLEDALEEDDWASWSLLEAQLGKETLIIGDDLIATNPARLERAIQKKACSGIVLKLNQIGTLSELLAVALQAKKSGLKTVVSHRSGETLDTFVADLAVAIQSDYVKFGAPARGERVAKYNRLLQIENEILHH